MTTPYNMSSSYPQGTFQPYPNNYVSQPTDKPIVASAVTAASLGFTGGAIYSIGADYIKNRHPVKNGNVSDSFAKQVMDKMINKGCSVKGREFFKQKNELLKKLKKVKSPEEFTKLMNKYKQYASTLCDGISLDSMCKMVNKDNIKGKISALKTRIEASLEPEIRNIKDAIKLCWDSENKKFVKPKEVEEKIFKVIKNTKNSIQWKKMFKYGGITAGVFGVMALALSMLTNNRSEQS